MACKKENKGVLHEDEMERTVEGQRQGRVWLARKNVPSEEVEFESLVLLRKLLLAAERFAAATTTSQLSVCICGEAHHTLGV